ncbi:MAG: HAMP domain-containing histidine kinase [Solirubrobacterales bacterium]|nr:HAMP domain-containing histidine kinase [Solirubrobacterales bacterium]
MGSLRNRLAFIVLLIVMGAVAVVLVGVLPRLEADLRDEALHGLGDDARRYAPQIKAAVDRGVDAPKVDGVVRDTADRAGARVTLFGVNRAVPKTYIVSDSTRENRISDLQFEVAAEAARRGAMVTGTEAGDAGRIGEAALPLFTRDATTGRRVVGSVVVFSAPLNDLTDQVGLVRDRMLVAALVAILAAALAGWLVARALAWRVRRIEQVAGRVAQGDFEARFPVDASDELGQLAWTLDHMRRQLAELDSARKRFIATASHELRTPLFSLGGFLELLEDEDVDEEDRRRFLAQLRQQVIRLQKLATDLLDLSRLEAGSLELRPEPTDVGTLARAVATEFTPALSAHDAHLELRLPPQPVEVQCDPDRVAQVMRILIDNAITHTPPGTDLVLSASRRDGTVRLGVGDFGPGIHRTMLPRIFEPFVTTDDAQGSGLGLAIARELAERMDGRLAVESQPGRTTFTLELPA